MALTTNQRRQAVEFLTENCDCWKFDGAADVLNELPDETLTGLRARAEGDGEAAATLNAVREMFDLGDDAAAEDLPDRVAERVEEYAAAKATEAVQNARPTRRTPPAPTSNKRLVGKKEKEPDPEDVYEDMEDEEDEMPMMRRQRMKKVFSKNSVANGRGGSDGRGIAHKPMEELLEEYGTKEQQAIWNYNKQRYEQDRSILTEQLQEIANNTHNAVKAREIKRVLATRPDIATLQGLLALTSERREDSLRPRKDEPTANYYGAVGGAVGPVVGYVGYGSSLLTENEQNDVLDLESAREEYEPPTRNGKATRNGRRRDEDDAEAK